MNSKIITVKGIGNVSAKPDMIAISVTQETSAREYDKTMEKAALDLDGIRKAIAKAGHDPVKLKTSSFGIDTHYENKRDAQGNYKRYFKGYKCTHCLNLEFAYDMKELGKVLSALAGCEAKPEFSIRFYVKDQNAMKERMLENAVANAMSKADILTKAAGVKLGEILRIDYSWGELEVYSRTRYETRLAFYAEEAPITDMNMEPEDVEASDTVTVVWAIN